MWQSFSCRYDFKKSSSVRLESLDVTGSLVMRMDLSCVLNVSMVLYMEGVRGHSAIRPVTVVLNTDLAYILRASYVWGKRNCFHDIPTSEMPVIKIHFLILKF